MAQKRIDVSANNEKLELVIKRIAKEYQISFFYSNNLKSLQQKVSVQLKNVTIQQAMNELLKGTDLVYKVLDDQILIKRKKEIDVKDKGWIVPPEQIKKKIETKEVKKEVPLPKIQQFNVSGYLKDSLTDEDIIGGIIQDLEGKVLPSSDNHGFFSLRLEEGAHIIRFSANGYIADTVKILITKDTLLTVMLSLNETLIAPVIITSSDKNDLFSSSYSKKELNYEKKLSKGAINSDDVIENIRTEAGVVSKSEGATGYFVKGGNHDQNLILVDGAPVYNESHFLGLLSIFNSSSIKKATLYKSGIPAEFGSRLSSVLDIQMKDGNKETYQGHIFVSPYYMDYSSEGPLKKDRASFFVSGRNSILGFLYRTPLKKNFDLDQFKFYDFNAKLNYKLNSKNRFFLSGYYGRDVFKTYSTSYLLNESWGNEMTTFRWNHIFNEKLYNQSQIIYSRYSYNNYKEFDDQLYYLDTRIKSFTLKDAFSYYLSNQHKIGFGFQSQFQIYDPGSTFISSDTVQLIDLKFNNTLENAIYVQDDWKYSEKLTFNVGIRYSLFFHLGKGTNYTFGTFGQVDSTQQKGIYNTYGTFEPRLKVTYKLADNQLLQASFDQTSQYLVLASNSISRSPTDVWVPATNNIKPMRMSLFSSTYSRLLAKDVYSLSTGVYYKKIENVVDFIDNAYLKLNQLIESQIKQGKGVSYGFELSFSKQKGDFTYSFNYQLGRATYKIEEINNGKKYFAPYDKLHSANLNLNYQIAKKWVLQSNVVATSGVRTTYPIATYVIQGSTFVLYNERNADRLPMYFRVDFAATYRFESKEHWKHELSLSVYNLTNRKNPYSISFLKNTETAYLNYLLPIIPSISYKLLLR